MPELASHRIRRERFEDSESLDVLFEEDLALRPARSRKDARPSAARGNARQAEPELAHLEKELTISLGTLSDQAIEGVRSFGDNQRLRGLQIREQVSRDPDLYRPFMYDISRFATIPTAETTRGFLRTYSSARPEPVPSDGAPHRLLIGRIELPFTEERRAVPELVERVFRRLRAPLTGDDPCLAGSAAVFLDGAYLGTSRVPTTAPGEEIVLDLGVDEQIVVVRRQEDREDEVGVFSKSRRYRTTVTLELVNHHSEAKTVDLRERIPFTESDRISIELDDDKTKPTPDRVRKSSGLVDWTLLIPAGGKRTVTLRYNINAPRALQLTRTPAPQRLEEDDR